MVMVRNGYEGNGGDHYVVCNVVCRKCYQLENTIKALSLYLFREFMCSKSNFFVFLA